MGGGNDADKGVDELINSVISYDVLGPGVTDCFAAIVIFCSSHCGWWRCCHR